MSRTALPRLLVKGIPHSGDLALISYPMTRSPGMSRKVSSSSANLVTKSPTVKSGGRYTLTKVMLTTVAQAPSLEREPYSSVGYFHPSRKESPPGLC